MKLFPQPIIEKLAADGRAHAERMAEDDDYQITPLFVSVTDDMLLTDHDGIPAGGA